MAALAAVATSVCASCIFGAAATRLLSYNAPVETVTVQLVPHVTVYPDGNRITSLETVTASQSVPLAAPSGRHRTYSHVSDLTWTVGGATLTYPSTYIEYRRFAGATRGPHGCAQPVDVRPVRIGSISVGDLADFIYPYVPGDTTLPVALLQFLGNISTVSAQFGGDALTGCASLAPAGPSSQFAILSTIANSFAPTIQTSLPASFLPKVPKSTIGASSVPAMPSTSGGASSVPTRPSNSSGASFLPSISRSIRASSLPTIQSTSIGTSSIQPTSVGASSIPPLPPTTPIFLSSIPVLTIPVSSRPGVTVQSFSLSVAPGDPSHSQHNSGFPTVKQGHTTAFIVSVITGRPLITTVGTQSTRLDQTAPLKTPTFDGQTTSLLIGSTTSSEHQQIQSSASSTSNGATPGTSPVAGPNGGPTAKHPLVKPITGTGDGTPVAHSTDDEPGRATNSAPHAVVTEKSNGVVVFSGKTISPGHSVTVGTGSLTTIVVLHTQYGSTQLRVGDHTYAVAATPPAPPQYFQSVIVTKGYTFTAREYEGSLVLADASRTSTVPPGSVATFDGQTVSAMGQSGRILVNGIAETLSPMAVSTATLGIFTGSKAFSAVEETGSVVLQAPSTTTTVRDGTKVTFAGHTVSVGPNGGTVVINRHTMTLSTCAVPTQIISIPGTVHTGAPNGAASFGISNCAILGLLVFVILL